MRHTQKNKYTFYSPKLNLFILFYIIVIMYDIIEIILIIQLISGKGLFIFLNTANS